MQSLFDKLGDTAEELSNNSSYLIVGDGDGDVPEISGLLLEIQESGKFEGKKNFLIINSEGEEKIVCGNASIESKVNARCIGKIIQLRFLQWAKTEKGQRFKDIEVFVGGETYTREEFLEKLGLDHEKGGQLGF